MHRGSDNVRDIIGSNMIQLLPSMSDCFLVLLVESFRHHQLLPGGSNH